LLVPATGPDIIAWLIPDRSMWTTLAGVRLPPLVDGPVRLEFPRLPSMKTGTASGLHERPSHMSAA